MFTGKHGPYFGMDSADTIYFKIPCTWPNGTYEIRVNDDQGCNNCANPNGNTSNFCGWGNKPTFNVNNPALPNLAYGDSTFCVGESSLTPTNVMPAGTYVDVTYGGSPLQNLVSNTTTGALSFHSGTVSGNAPTIHLIRYTKTAPCLIRDSTNITVKPMLTDTMTYTGGPYCKNLSSISPPSHTASTLTGSYSVNPALTGFNTSTGGVAISPPSAAGAYTVTFTPNANACGYVATTQMEIVNLDSAIFAYAPTYCNGDAQGGYPISVTSLPLNGGYFRDSLPIGGLVIDSTIGKIDLTQPGIVGPHTIGYFPNQASCGVVKYVHIDIRDPNPSSFMVRDTTVCANSGTLNVFPTSSGVFYCPSGNIFFSDTINGVINTDSSSSGGPYLIYHTNNDPVCPDTTQGHITLTPRVIPSFNYGGTLFCEGYPNNPAPTFTAGATGGIFSAPPVGPDSIFVDSTTGVIDLALSDPGIYNIYYQTPTGPGTCPASDTIFALKIAVTPDATFAYPTDSACVNSGFLIFNAPFPPASGGDFDSWKLFSPTGALIPNGMVGDSLDTGLPTVGGQYRIMRTSTKATCVDSFVDYVSIIMQDDASFNYVPDTFCGVDQNPIPSIFYTGGGIFTNGDTNNLVFAVPGVGMVDLLASAPGNHHIVYTTRGFCPDRDTAFLYIRDELNPRFDYTSYEFCETTTDTIFAHYDTAHFVLGSVIFTSVPSTPALNSSNGTFQLASVPPDSYIVTMTLTNPQQACSDHWDETVIISPQGADTAATMQYVPSTFCITQDSAFPNLVTLDSNGIYYSSPNTLVWQNRSNGVIDINNSPPGTYFITYVKQNACLDVLRDTIVIGVPTNPVLTFYADSLDTVPKVDFCKSDTIPPVPRLVPSSLGLFTAVNLQDTSLHMVFLSDTTGQINLGASPPGVYEITFTELNGCTGSGTQRIRINTGPIVDLYIQEGDSFCVGDEVNVKVRGGNDYDIFVNGQIKRSDSTWTTTALQDSQIVIARVRDNIGCLGFDTVQVKVFPVPVGIVEPHPSTISGAVPIEFSMGTTAPNTYFTWTATAGGSVTIPYYTGSTKTFSPPDTARIRMDQSLGSNVTPGVVVFSVKPFAEICPGDSQLVRFFINPNDSAIFVPEVFTPNTEDNINATWQIQWRDDVIPEEYEIFIYNRSGGQVDHLDKLMNTWNGNDLPDGVYWFLIKHRISAYQIKGALTIRRK